MPFRLNLRLQSLVLLGLIPGLVVLTIVLGSAIYRPLYSIIMTGFEGKLLAVSTVTGAFIAGEDHEQLFEIREIADLTENMADGIVYGIDSRTDRLVWLDLEEGGALDVWPLPAGSTGVTADPAGDRYWVVTAEPARLFVLDGETGEPSPVGDLRTRVFGLAYDPIENVLYGGGDELTSIDPGTARQSPVTMVGLRGQVRAPTIDLAANALYLIQETDDLVRVDLTTRRVTATTTMYDADPAPEEERLFRSGPPPVMTALAATSEGTLIGAADRMVRIDPSTAAVDSARTAPGFRSSQHPAYLQYVAPMRRIMEKAGVTYLYTESVELGGRLTYGIDATTGENHSVIGTIELIPDEEIAPMERALVEGQVRLSGIEEWGSWGLLKTADAPIYRRDGGISALASADLDITVILDRTRLALVKVGGVAALTLLLGAIISLLIARRLVTPLTQVKEGALQLAAGRYGHKLPDQELVELRELSDSFNKMSDALGDTIAELTRTNEALETVRRRRALELALAERLEAGVPPPFRVDRLAADTDIRDPSGYAHVGGEGGGRLVAWLVDPLAESPIENLRYRREVEAIARAMLEQGEPWERIGPLLLEFNPRTYCVALIDAETSTVRAATRRPTEMALVESTGHVRSIEVGATPYHVDPKDWIVLSSADPDAYARWASIRPPTDRSRADSAGDLVVCFFGHAALDPDARAQRRQLRIEVAGTVRT